MGLFDKLKKKEKVDWSSAYVGKPNFYGKPDGSPFGAFALTEDTLTSFPKNPKALYKVDSAEVEEWKMVLVSITKDGILGDIDYYEGIKRLSKFIIDETENNILIKNLSLEEISSILK